MAKIQLNGRNLKIEQKLSIKQLLGRYKLDENKIAIELNGSILSKAMFKKTFLKNKDKIEIVHFIGGG
tara:strand:+ start:998 stop:1201 length:204 start_codon:yes stop_codon:yes gene_type:complete